MQHFFQRDKLHSLGIVPPLQRTDIANSTPKHRADLQPRNRKMEQSNEEQSKKSSRSYGDESMAGLTLVGCHICTLDITTEGNILSTRSKY